MSLTEREATILQLLSEGYLLEEIAKKLGSIPSTLGGDISVIYQKYESRKRYEAAVCVAIRCGDIVGPELGEIQLELLSPRERDVVVWLCEGMGNEEIGAKLHIAPATVAVHMMRMKKRLGTRGRAHLAALVEKFLTR